MIFLDLETTSLNPEIGILACVGLILPDGREELIFVEPEKEREAIESAMNSLRKFRGERIVIWYSKFDIPFLVTRAIKNGVDISDIYEFKIIDLCKLVQENLKLASNKLDDVSRFLGVEKDISINGRKVHQLYIQAIKGNEEAKEKILNHCKDDLRAMKKIFQKLKPYIEKWVI